MFATRSKITAGLIVVGGIGLVARNQACNPPPPALSDLEGSLPPVSVIPASNEARSRQFGDGESGIFGQTNPTAPSVEPDPRVDDQQDIPLKAEETAGIAIDTGESALPSEYESTSANIEYELPARSEPNQEVGSIGGRNRDTSPPNEGVIALQGAPPDISTIPQPALFFPSHLKSLTFSVNPVDWRSQLAKVEAETTVSRWNLRVDSLGDLFFPAPDSSRWLNPRWLETERFHAWEGLREVLTSEELESFAREALQDDTVSPSLKGRIIAELMADRDGPDVELGEDSLGSDYLNRCWSMDGADPEFSDVQDLEDLFETADLHDYLQICGENLAEDPRSAARLIYTVRGMWRGVYPNPSSDVPNAPEKDRRAARDLLVGLAFASLDAGVRAEAVRSIGIFSAGYEGETAAIIFSGLQEVDSGQWSMDPITYGELFQSALRLSEGAAGTTK